MCGKEEQGPSPEGKNFEWMLKEPSETLFSRPGRVSLRFKWGMTVRCVLYFGAMSGDDVEE